MKHLTHKTIGLPVLFIFTLLVFGQFIDTTEAATRQSRSGRTEIRRLERQDVVENLRIPILFGVKVGDLEDTWGDARSGGRTHEGIDIIVPRGEFIVSPTDAVVIEVEDSGNGGKHVYTANPGGERYYFAHLDSYAEDIEEGDVLAPGDLIGYVGNTGNASGGVTHLHFGISGEDHDAANPFPRLTREFSGEDRVKAFIKILEDVKNPVEVARKTVNQFKTIFVEAQASGIKLPSSITRILLEKRTEVLGITRILQLNMKGDDVKLLQTALGISADGSFGAKTKAGVIAFQKSVGLGADGVFGVTTRLALGNSSIAATTLPPGCTLTTIYSPTTGIKC